MAQVGDIYEVRFFCEDSGQRQASVNVRHYRIVSVAGSGVTNQVMADFLSSNLNGEYKAVLSASAQYRGCGVRRIKPLPAETETFSSTGQGAGVGNGNSLPTQTCGIITLRTSLGGPRYRGRAYIPFPSEGDNNLNGLPEATYITGLNALGAKLVAGFTPGSGGNTVDMLPVIYSRKYGTSQDVISYVSRSKWGTQRSRGSYGAVNASPV